MTKCLLTGSAGFLGHHLLARILEDTDWNVVCLDRLDSAGNLARLANSRAFQQYRDRVEVVFHDLRAVVSKGVGSVILTGNFRWGHEPFDHVLHLAAGSHVDRSVLDPAGFVLDNVLGTAHLLDFCREYAEQTLYFSCYDEKTRALTSDGFKSYDQLKVGDTVFGIDENGDLKEQPVQRVIVQDYAGDMVRFRNSRVNLLVTPNHRMYGKDRNGSFCVEEASQTASRKMADVLRVHRPRRWKGECPKTIHVEGVGDVPAKELMHLCGLFIGDGFVADQVKIQPSTTGYTKAELMKLNRDATTGRMLPASSLKERGPARYVRSNSYRIFFDIPVEDPAREHLRKTLDALGVKYTEHSGKSGTHVYVGSQAWSNFFRQFGKGAANKRIPRWIFKLDFTLLKELFNGLIDSDGSWQTVTPRYTTVSKGLVSDLCELAFKLGLLPKTFVREPREGCRIEGRLIRAGVAYDVTFARKRTPKIGKHNASVVDYSGKIWCVQVPFKNLIVERDGALVVCGNTDEVFGPADGGESFGVNARLNPNNPYAASKAGGELLCPAYANTYGMRIRVTRCANAYGPGQDREKFIPLCIRNVLAGRKVQIHARASGSLIDRKAREPSSRLYTHHRNVTSAVLKVVQSGDVLNGDDTAGRYNISGGEEQSNLHVAQEIARLLDRELRYELVVDPPGRPRPDMRYGIDASRLRALGWEPEVSFDDGLKETVEAESQMAKAAE